MNFQKLKQNALEKHKENLKFFEKLKQKPPKNLDYIANDCHEEAFSETDCLSCANCCKTTGPLFTTADIERISKFLKMKVQAFTEKFLRTDEDGDLVFKEMPCPFLGADNYCHIYEVRPKACREYPHTDRKKIYQIAKITLKNTEICPIAYNVVEKMKEKIKF